MKKMKVIDIDKFMDRVFLHNKNADERLWDFILRSATFIFLVVFVLLFATIRVRASDSGYIDVLLLGDNTLSLQPYFNNTDWGTVHSQYPDTTPYYTNNFSFVNEVPGHVVLTDDMDYENYYVAIGRCYYSGISDSACVLFIPKDLANSNNIYICNNGYIYSDVQFNSYIIWFNKRQSEDTSLYERYDVTIPQGYNEFRTLSNLQFSSSFYWYLTNMDYLTCDSLSELNDYLTNGESEDCFNANYLVTNDLIEIPLSEEVESNKNHLYFKDVQIGLTSTSSDMEILGSSVVIGCDVDDWVKNHVNDYWVYVSYRVHMKDTDFTIRDPNQVYGQYLPLRTFQNDVYTCSITDIFRNMPMTGYNNFLEYYYHIKSTKSIKITNHNGIWNKNGIFPMFMRGIGIEVSDFSLNVAVKDNYAVTECGLEVRVVLCDNPQIGMADTSGVFAKDFDFLYGTSSITKADGLYNSNPWTGETTPNDPNKVDPNIPSGNTSNGSGGASAIAYGGNVNVTINNGLGGDPNDITNNPSPTESIQEIH